MTIANGVSVTCDTQGGSHTGSHKKNNFCWNPVRSNSAPQPKKEKLQEPISDPVKDTDPAQVWKHMQSPH